MSWRLAVTHTTGYRYERPVVASYNEARLTPLSVEGQLTIDARVEVVPRVRMGRYRDYWGSVVHPFDVHVAHSELVVTASSLVDTRSTPSAPTTDGPGWDVLSAEALDRYYEFLAPTATVPEDAELADIAGQIRAGAATPGDAVVAAREWVGGQLAYEKGSTSVSTSAIEAWRSGRGVCQDYVHLTLALLRAMGVPARYVSGYFHPEAEAGPGDTVTADSHAWAEAWTGEWHAFDPTNNVVVGHRHVMLARARDYRDVAPLKGVYSGAPSSTPNVAVTLTRR
ncbi:MAG TPA: transglutaminase family protein [Acidimicrobiales bacterium]|nr:transglutaminase family protein [Acidimicrobiales bacterium]